LQNIWEDGPGHVLQRALKRLHPGENMRTASLRWTQQQIRWERLSSKQVLGPIPVLFQKREIRSQRMPEERLEPILYISTGSNAHVLDFGGSISTPRLRDAIRTRQPSSCID
jgi:hypothetical protein